MRATDLIAGGYCTPQCLLALSAAHDRAVCKCRCDGRGHGLMADAEVDFDVRSAALGKPPLLAAPTFACGVCGKPISKKRTHILASAEGGPVVISFCCIAGDSRRLHADLWPSCPHLAWHDFYDHESRSGTRAGIYALMRREGIVS